MLNPVSRPHSGPGGRLPMVAILLWLYDARKAHVAAREQRMYR